MSSHRVYKEDVDTHIAFCEKVYKLVTKPNLAAQFQTPKLQNFDPSTCTNVAQDKFYVPKTWAIDLLINMRKCLLFIDVQA